LCAVKVGGRTLLASGGNDDTVRLWDPATGEALRGLEGHTGTVRTLCPVELGGQTLLAFGGNDRTVRLWDILAATVSYEVPVHHNATALATPSVQSLVIGLSAGLLAVTIRANAGPSDL
jgi:WD40 repeat protein